MDANTKLKATNLGKIAGNTALIIETIGEGTTTTTILREKLQLGRLEAGVYLRRLRDYGIVKRENYGLYSLTDTGILYYTKLKLNRSLTDDIQTYNRCITDRIDKIKELRLDKWIELKDPTEIQQVVVGVLVKNYNDSGEIGTARPFVLYKDLYQVRLDANINEEDFHEALQNLHKQGILWQYPPGALRDNCKIGLSKKFIKWLKQYGS